jgi:hypothetical protein
MLPHVMFVRDFEERMKVTMCCCLGWNISLFPAFAQREQHIEMVWKMVDTDNQEPPASGMKERFKQNLRLLISKKHDLFP